MSLTIMRRIRFSAGHRLLGHGGKCEYFHGHNYVAEIYVQGDGIDGVGRVVDFAELKKLFKGWIDQHWDHGFLLNVDDQNGIDAIKRVEPSKYYLLPENPTAESIAKHLLEVVAPQLLEPLSGQGLRATKVVIWETEESSAEAAIESH